MHKTKRSTEKQTTQPEFPGAPIWEEWLHEQQKLKKREIGLPRRLGRMALEAAAATTVLGASVTRTLALGMNVKREQYNTMLTGSLANRSTPKQEAPTGRQDRRLRRLGTEAIVGASAKRQERASRKSRELGAKITERQPLGSLTARADRYLNRIEHKRNATRQRREGEFQALKDEAWGQYLDANPEVEKRLQQEQAELNRQNEIERQRNLYNVMTKSARFATEYFSRRSSYSFSKSLPRPQDLKGSYDDLAKTSLMHAVEHRQEDGSIALFDPQMLAEDAKQILPLSPLSWQTDRTFDRKYDQAVESTQNNLGYVGGVSVALWKLGFVEFDTERDITSGDGHRMNPNIIWDSEGQSTLASLPYDPENELHRLVTDEPGFTNPMIQIAISGGSYDYSVPPAINVSMVEQPIQALPQAA